MLKLLNKAIPNFVLQLLRLLWLNCTLFVYIFKVEGLGLKDLVLFNKALLSKLACKFITNYSLTFFISC